MAYTPPSGDAVDFDFGYPSQSSPSPVPYAPPAFDAVHFDLAGHLIESSGWLSLAIGEPTLGIQIKTQSVFDAWFGSAVVTNGAAIIEPTGIGSGAFGDAYVNVQQTAVPSSISQFGAGSAVIYNSRQYAEPTGFSGFSYGGPTIFNSQQFLRPSGFSAGGVGSLAKIINRTRTLDVFGVAAGSVPLVHRVEHSVRTLAPPSIWQTAFGVHDLAGGIRWIDHAGRGSGPQAFGATFIAPAVRFTYPVGIHALMWGKPVVDQTHFVDGLGFDGIKWGVSWIHDNKQYAEGAGNFNSIVWGLPEVTRSPRELAPMGFSLRDILPNERWGRPDVWNLRQYVRHYHDIEPDEGGVFGSPLHMAIENRNRTVGAVGFIASRIPNSAVIENTGRPLIAQGWDSGTFGFNRDGLGFIAYRIRSVKPTDEIGPERFSNWNAVLKTPQMFPVGIAPAGIGRPHLDRGPEFHPVGFGGERLGTAFIAPRVRTLAQYYAYEGRVAEPDVQLWERAVAPAGIMPRQVGAHTLEHHRNEFFPRWNWQHDLMGTEVVVRNVTPEIYQHGAMQTEWGTAEIRWNPYPLRPSGLPALAWGGNTIEHREKCLGVYGIAATRWGPNTQIRNDQPDPPWTRTYAASGFVATQVGIAAVRSNHIAPPGIYATLFGPAIVMMMGCYQSGWLSMKFGLPAVSGPQYVFASGMPSINDDAFDPSKGWGLPRFSPFTIYCTGDKPAGYTPGGTWSSIDDALYGNSDRPAFGSAFVSNQYRVILATSYAPLVSGGAPSVDLRDRSVYPNGSRMTRFGYPSLPAPLDVGPFSVDGDEAFGNASLMLRNRSIAVSGNIVTVFGKPMAMLLNRDVAPTGWDSFTMSSPVSYNRKDFGPLSNRIHFPEPIIAGGQVLGEWGVNWISHRIRTVAPVGFDSFLSDYTWEDFKGRMKVKARGHFYPPSILPLLGFGVAFIDQSIRNIHGAGNIRAGWMGSPEVRFISNVALGGYGWDSSEFGDVDRWEPGKIKPHGDDFSIYGNRSKVNRGVHAQGWDSAAFGDIRRGDAIDPAGFDGEAWGIGTITHGDAMEFTCGGLPRGIPPQGFVNTGWGTAEIAHV